MNRTLVQTAGLADVAGAADHCVQLLAGNWDRLPMRMAVHFDANWQPNGYTSREGALMLGLGIMVFMLVVFTIGVLIAHALKPAAAWPLLMVFYVALGFVWFGNHSIVEWNLNPPPAHSELMGANSPAVRDSERNGVF